MSKTISEMQGITPSWDMLFLWYIFPITDLQTTKTQLLRWCPCTDVPSFPRPCPRDHWQQAANRASSKKWQWTLNLPHWFILLAVWRATLTKHSPWSRALQQSSSVDPNTRPSQLSMRFTAPSHFWIPSPDLIYLESSMKTPGSESSVTI